MSDTGKYIISVISEDTKAPLRIKEAFNGIVRRLKLPEALTERIEMEYFASLAGFLQAQKTRKDLSGAIIDASLVRTGSEIQKRAIELIESLAVPTLKFDTEAIPKDTVGKQLLEKRVRKFLDEVSNFTPRGIRSYPRRICFVKIRYQRPGVRDADQGREISVEVRACTYDLSKGGCFIVSMEDWADVEEINIRLGEYSKQIKCKITWRLPWGASTVRMPGIGVQFVDTGSDLQDYIERVLKD